MDVKFPYKYTGANRFGKIYRPVAKVSFQSLKTFVWSNIWMVVDTGADFTILPKYLAANLQVNLKTDCHTDMTTGVGGTQAIYLCRDAIKAKIGHLERTIPLAFFNSNDVPPLLGRLGFLETFNTEFQTSKMVVFKEK